MFRSTALTSAGDKFLLSNDRGEYAIVSDEVRNDLSGNRLPTDHPRYFDFLAKGFVERAQRGGTGLEQAAFHTRKASALTGPSLHIFVVTLRCDHACAYCQVSRASLTASGKDMSFEHADLAIDRVFESPSDSLTVEFQGGEPTLRFDLIRYIVEQVEVRNHSANKVISFSMVSTLHQLGEDELHFCRDHQIHISTSIDGPADIHNAQRRNPGNDAWERTLSKLAYTRSIVGRDGVVAMPTLTKAALAVPKAIVDTYLDLGFASIFLRPMSAYGFARKTRKTIGYDMADYISFYEEALDYLLTLNAAGIEIVETYSAILLRHIFTPFGSNYVDLRSPAGAGLAVIVYNYDGKVYPADEARMAAETGDTRFTLGTVNESLDELLESEAMRWLATGAVAEALPGCRDCAFVPFCGADPVYHAVFQGDPIGVRETSEFCQKHMGMFKVLFRHMERGDPETLRTFQAWAFQRSRQDIIMAGYVEA
jgi:His-Xaa-Ser system radical SAM maturase HxsB